MKAYGIVVTVIFCLMLCACSAQPAYMTPYGDGTPVRPATASTIKTLTPKTTTTAFEDNGANAEVEYVVCPECNGEKLICLACDGLGKAPESVIEYFDEDSGIWVKKGSPCLHCEQDPGFQYCENCNNELVVPVSDNETTLETGNTTEHSSVGEFINALNNAQE